MKKKKIRLYSALEVANICGVANMTMINWIKKGYITAMTTPGGQYRLYPDVVKHFLETRGMKVPPEINAAINENKESKRLYPTHDDKY